MSTEDAGASQDGGLIIKEEVDEEKVKMDTSDAAGASSGDNPWATPRQVGRHIDSYTFAT